MLHTGYNALETKNGFSTTINNWSSTSIYAFEMFKLNPKIQFMLQFQVNRLNLMAVLDL